MPWMGYPRRTHLRVWCPFLSAPRAGRPCKAAVLHRRARGTWRLRLRHKEILESGVEPDVRAR